MRVYQSETIAKLSDALSKAQSETQHASKSADNPFFKSKYADLPAVIDAARPHLTKHGLSVHQVTDFDESGMMLVTQLNHSSGEWVRGYYPVKPVKNDPQGMGSALTYARRYSYQSIAGIATSADDDDGNAASNNAVKPESAASKKRRFTAVLNAIKTSNDPATTWHEHLAEINEFKADEYTGQEMYEELAKAGAQRKKELEQMAIAQAGMPEEFKNVGGNA